MRMEAIDSRRIAIELSKDDLKKLNITFEEMDYGNIETRRVIWTLLDEARKTLHCDIDPSGRLIVEAVPLPDGGCILHFTVPQLSSRIVRCEPVCEAVVYKFDSADDLAVAAERINSLSEKVDSELYTALDENSYRLIVYPNGSENLILNILSEHGVFCGKGSLFAAFVREHCVSVLQHDVFEKLA